MRTIDEISMLIVSSLYDDAVVMEFFESKEQMYELRVDSGGHTPSPMSEVFCYKIDDKYGHPKFVWDEIDETWKTSAILVNYIASAQVNIDITIEEMRQWVLVKDTPAFENFFLLLSMRVI